MDPRLLKYYNRELQHIRETAAEFAGEFPKIAGRLGLEGFECADPYVERLLEGFAFLTGRVQLQIDAEFPRFTQHLLEMVFPHYLAPVPSMAVVQFQADLTEGSLAEGFAVPRGTRLRSIFGKGDKTPCEYRTSHDVTLWPLEVVAADYFVGGTVLAGMDVPNLGEVKAGIRLRLHTTAGVTFDKLGLQRLCFYLNGSEALPMHLYEQLLANVVAMVARSPDRDSRWYEILDKEQIRRVGFDESQALFPYGPRSFQGYRLLQEYFAFPNRFMFVELNGLEQAVRRCTGDELELLVLFDRTNPLLENVIDRSNFLLFCTPSINLFPKSVDRIHLSEQTVEHHVVPDRTRPMDFEVYGVTRAVGYGTSAEQKQEFLPFYSLTDAPGRNGSATYYTLRREPRMPSSKQLRTGSRSSYIGSEVFVSLVDADEAPYSTDLRQLAIETLCTNRDLPIHMPVGVGKSDFQMDVSAPVEAVRVRAGPTKPRSACAEGEAAWRAVSHLSLNYLSLVNNDDATGAAALRELLNLYADRSDAVVQKQIEGVRAVSSHPVIRRLPEPGPITFGRGLEVTVTLEEAAFEGTGVFLLGAVLDEFIAKYASINSFTETVVTTTNRGEIMRWPARLGRRLTV